MNARIFLLLFAMPLALGTSIAGGAVISQLQFQDGATNYAGGPIYSGTQDAFLSGSTSPDQTTFNYGASPTLTIADRSVDRDALIRFDMTGIGSTFPIAGVTSASLKFTTSNVTNFADPNHIYDLFLVAPSDQAWLEGSANGATPAVGTGATYTHEIYSGTAWAGGNTRTPVALTTAGTVGTQIASIDLGAVLPLAGSTFTFSITDPTSLAFIETWVAGGANGGFVVLGRGRDVFSTTDSPFWNVDSSEATVVANRPQLALSGNFSNAPLVAAYDFENASGLTSVDSAANSVAGSIVTGSGLGGGVANDRGEQNIPPFVPGTNDQSMFFTLSNAALSSAAAARAADDYFTFTLTANPNQRLDLDLLSFRAAVSNIALSRTWTLDYAIDGGDFVNDFATGTFTGPQTTATNSPIWTPFTVDLSAPQFDSISSITFRLVQHGGTNSTHAGYFDKIQVTGQAFAVPEPSSSLLFVVAAIALVVWQTRAIAKTSHR